MAWLVSFFSPKMFSDRAVQLQHSPEAPRPGGLVVELVSRIIAHIFGLVDGS